MQINEIIMHGIKGQNTVQPLTGKDIFIGHNGAGKTTRLQTLGISMLGYCPGEGKTPAETYKLATENEMEVGLVLNDFNLSRIFQRKAKQKKDGSTEISVSQDIRISPSRGEKTLAQKEARIKLECGDFPSMLDFQQFLDLSDSKRRDFIYNLSPISADSWNRERVYEYLVDHLLLPDLEANDPDKYKVMVTLISGAMEQYPASYDVQAGILSMLEWAKAKQTHWNEEKKNAQGAVKKLSDLKNEIQQTDRNIDTNKKELDDLQLQLSNVKAQIAGDTEKAKAIEKRMTRLDELKKSMTELNNSLSKPLDLSHIDQQLGTEEAKIKVIDNTAQVAELQKQLEANSTESLRLQAEERKKYEILVECRTQIKTLNSQTEHIVNQKGICVISPLIGCNKDFAPFVQWASKEIERLQQLETTTQNEHDNITRSLNACGDKAKEINKQIQELNTNGTEQQKINDAARKVIAELKQKKVDEENARAKLSDKVNSLQEEYDKLQAEPVEPIAPIDILEKRRDGLQSQIDSLKPKLDDQQKAKTTLSNMRSSMIDSKEATYYADNCKNLVETLGPKGLQGDLVKGILEPIRGSIQENLIRMNIYNDFYFQTLSDTGREVFQFGWINENGRHVNFDVLSTGEKILLLSAMMVTLMDRSQPPLKVLAIDNIENLDRNNFKYALAGLDQLAGKLDNIILAGVIDPPELEGWKVWSLNQPQESEGVPQSAIA